jgi:hypothetical protein
MPSDINCFTYVASGYGITDEVLRHDLGKKLAEKGVLHHR